MEVNVFFGDVVTTIDMSPMEFSVIPARGAAGADGPPGTIENLSVTATTRSAGSSATASYSNNVLTLGIPRGNTGATGNGISNIQKTGTSGYVDTYTITTTNGSTYDFTVTNGNGSITVDTALSTTSTNAVQNKAIATALNAKAAAADVYTKTEADNLLSAKAAAADVYTKTETNGLLANKLSAADLLDLVYPVGSIYMSVSDVSPATIIGGTWVSFAAGRVLVGVDPEDEDFDNVQETGGEKTVTLTADEIPAHTHGNESITGQWSSMARSNDYANGVFSAGYNASFAAVSSGNAWGWKNYAMNASHEHDSVGGDQPHNNMPPYITCYMWRRTA